MRLNQLIHRPKFTKQNVTATLASKTTISMDPRACTIPSTTLTRTCLRLHLVTQPSLALGSTHTWPRTECLQCRHTTRININTTLSSPKTAADQHRQMTTIHVLRQVSRSNQEAPPDLKTVVSVFRVSLRTELTVDQNTYQQQTRARLLRIRLSSSTSLLTHHLHTSTIHHSTKWCHRRCSTTPGLCIMDITLLPSTYHICISPTTHQTISPRCTHNTIITSKITSTKEVSPKTFSKKIR